MRVNGDVDNMLFRIGYYRGYLEFEYFDHVGNRYDEFMLGGELKDFLECVYKEIGQVHKSLYEGGCVDVDDIGGEIYEIYM